MRWSSAFSSHGPHLLSEAPAAALAGSELTVTVNAPTNPRDFVTVVPKSSKDGFYAAYEYLEKGGSYKLTLPPDAGDYELRVLGASSLPSRLHVKR